MLDVALRGLLTHNYEGLTHNYEGLTHNYEGLTHNYEINIR